MVAQSRFDFGARWRDHLRVPLYTLTQSNGHVDLLGHHGGGGHGGGRGGRGRGGGGWGWWGDAYPVYMEPYDPWNRPVVLVDELPPGVQIVGGRRLRP